MNSSHEGQCSSSPWNDFEQRLQAAMAGDISRIIFLMILLLQRRELCKVSTAENKRVEFPSVGMEK